MANSLTASSNAEVVGSDVDNSTPDLKSGSVKYPRVTIRLTGDMRDIMEELEEATSASSPSEVVRRAIVVYHTLVQQRLAGNNPIVEISDGDQMKKVPIFL